MYIGLKFKYLLRFLTPKYHVYSTVIKTWFCGLNFEDILTLLRFRTYIGQPTTSPKFKTVVPM